MENILDLDRYQKLLDKKERLELENSDLFIENKSEFFELISYHIKLHYWISYQNREKYYLLISQYVKGLITPNFFQMEFLEFEKKDDKSAKIFLNELNLNKSSTFLINSIAIKFGSLLEEISELSETAQEFGPEDGINDEDFLELIKKIYSELIILQN